MHKYFLTAALLMVFGATSYMSVTGLMKVFSDNLILIAVLGAGMEMGKLQVVVYLHRNWNELSWLFRGLYAGVLAVLLLITTCEVLGYLSLNHKVVASETERLIDSDNSLTVEADLLRDRVRLIDETLAELPEGFVSRRISERKAAGYDVMQNRLLEIVRQRAELAGLLKSETGAAGPIFAVAEIFGVEGRKVAMFFIIVLVAILEPLSLGLAVAVSAVWAHCDEEPEAVPEVVVEPEELPIAAESVTTGDCGNDTLKGSVNYQRLMALVDEHRFTVIDLMKITGKKQSKTVEGWLEDKGRIPDKAIRALIKYVQGKPKLRVA